MEYENISTNKRPTCDLLTPPYYGNVHRQWGFIFGMVCFLVVLVRCNFQIIASIIKVRLSLNGILKIFHILENLKVFLLKFSCLVIIVFVKGSRTLIGEEERSS